MHFGDGGQRIHIILLERVFLAHRRSHRPEIIVEIPMAHHNVSYRWSDRELRSFEVQEWIYDGAWKLAADLAPSGGIHSCTSEPHNLRIETSERYGITQRFYSMSTRNICISVNGQLSRVRWNNIPIKLISLFMFSIFRNNIKAHCWMDLVNRQNNFIFAYFCIFVYISRQFLYI